MLCCLVWICSPSTCFCMYSWESLKSELCHNTHPPSSQRRSPTEIHVQMFYHLCASCQWPKVTISCLCYANRMRTTLATDCSPANTWFSTCNGSYVDQTMHSEILSFSTNKPHRGWLLHLQKWMNILKVFLNILNILSILKMQLFSSV